MARKKHEDDAEQNPCLLCIPVPIIPVPVPVPVPVAVP